ncbi:MAG: hypothetical protein ACE5HR_00385 [bacterium]
MKIRVNTKSLREALKGFTGIVNAKSSVEILQGVKIQTKDNQYITITGTDLEFFKTVNVPCEILEGGGFTTNLKVLQTWLKEIRSKEVMLEPITTNRYKVVSDSMNYMIEPHDLVDYPDAMPTEITDDKMNVDVTTLQDIYKKHSINTTSLHVDPAMHEPMTTKLSYICIDIDGEIIATSCNGYMVVRTTHLIEQGAKKRLLIKPKSLKLLLRNVKGGNVEIGWNNDCFLVQTKDALMGLKLDIDVNYPEIPYEGCLEVRYRVIIKTDELRTALKSMAFLGGTNKRNYEDRKGYVDFIFKENKLELVGTTCYEEEPVIEALLSLNNNIGNREIRLNPVFVLNALDSLDNGTDSLEFVLYEGETSVSLKNTKGDFAMIMTIRKDEDED